MSQNVAKCRKMSQNVAKCRKKMYEFTSTWGILNFFGVKNASKWCKSKNTSYLHQKKKKNLKLEKIWSIFRFAPFWCIFYTKKVQNASGWGKFIHFFATFCDILRHFATFCDILRHFEAFWGIMYACLMNHQTVLGFQAYFGINIGLFRRTKAFSKWNEHWFILVRV